MITAIIRWSLNNRVLVLLMTGIMVARRYTGHSSPHPLMPCPICRMYR